MPWNRGYGHSAQRCSPPLQQPDFAFLRFGVTTGTQNAVVVVDTGTEQDDPLAVEQKIRHRPRKGSAHRMSSRRNHRQTWLGSGRVQGNRGSKVWHWGSAPAEQLCRWILPAPWPRSAHHPGWQPPPRRWLLSARSLPPPRGQCSACGPAHHRAGCAVRGAVHRVTGR